jgi:hypothetical protein
MRGSRRGKHPAAVRQGTLRAGPLRQEDISAGNSLTVGPIRGNQPGPKREILQAVITGDPNEIHKAAHRDRSSEDSDVSTDPGGTWLIQHQCPLDRYHRPAVANINGFHACSSAEFATR